MPESPVSATKFSAAPPAKKAMSLDEMKTMMAGDMQKAASILGGTVVDSPETPKVAFEKEEPETKIDDEDKRRYIRSLLAKEQFTKVYSLFGGRLQATFRTRKVSENETILNMPEASRYHARLSASLLTLDLGEQGKMLPVALTDVDDVAHAAISQCFKAFEELCDELFRRANDPDFWMGTAGRI